MQQFYDHAGDMAFVLDGIREWEVMTWMGEPDPEYETRVARVLREKGFVPLLAVEPAHFDTPALNALTATVIDYLVQHHGRDMVRRLIEGVQRYHTWPVLIRSGLLPYRKVAEGSHDRAWWRFVAQRYRLPSPQDRSRDEVLASLRWMLQLENQAVETGDQELFQMLLDPERPPRWQSNQLDLMLKGGRSEPMLKPADIRDWGYRDDSAWVVVGLTPGSPDFGLLSTTLRFFRFADQRWYLTSAEVVFSGPPLRLRTERLEFRYREPDAPLMKSTIPNVDALYQQTARDLGVELEPGKQLAITFVYEPESAPLFFGGSPDEVVIPAPGFSRTFRPSAFSWDSLSSTAWRRRSSRENRRPWGCS